MVVDEEGEISGNGSGGSSSDSNNGSSNSSQERKEKRAWGVKGGRGEGERVTSSIWGLKQYSASGGNWGFKPYSESGGKTVLWNCDLKKYAVINISLMYTS